MNDRLRHDRLPEWWHAPRQDRFSFSVNDKPKELPNGMLELSGMATCAGIFDYADDEYPDGIRKEYRPLEEVTDPESLASLRGAPLVIWHPDEESYPDGVTPTNAKTMIVGWVVEVEVRGIEVWVRVVVATEEGMQAVRRGLSALSCGYFPQKLDQGEGKNAFGLFHVTQRKIRYNHLALVDRGRAGARARLRLDRKNDVAKKKNAKSKSRGDQEMMDEEAKVMIEIPGQEPISKMVPMSMIETLMATMDGRDDEALSENQEEEKKEDQEEDDMTEDRGEEMNEDQEEDDMNKDEKDKEGRNDRKPAPRLDAADVDRIVNERLSNMRADMARDANLIARARAVLPGTYDFDRGDALDVEAATIAQVHNRRADAASKLVKTIRNDKADDAAKAYARGRLDSWFDEAVTAHQEAPEAPLQRQDNGEPKLSKIQKIRQDRAEKRANALHKKRAQ